MGAERGTLWASARPQAAAALMPSSTHPATDEPGSRNAILLRKPPDTRIERFLKTSAPCPSPTPRWAPRATERRQATRPNRLRGRLGAGPETFARAVEASGVGRSTKRDGPSSAGPMSPSRELPVPKRMPPPFRRPSAFIVSPVMSVMSGTFPDTDGGFSHDFFFFFFFFLRDDQSSGVFGTVTSSSRLSSSRKWLR